MRVALSMESPILSIYRHWIDCAAEGGARLTRWVLGRPSSRRTAPWLISHANTLREERARFPSVISTQQHHRAALPPSIAALNVQIDDRWGAKERSFFTAGIPKPLEGAAVMQHCHPIIPLGN